MTCWGCTSAAGNPRSGYYGADCDDCFARQLAQSPEFFRSVEADSFTPAYRAALDVVFGEKWSEGHAKVKAASERLKDARIDPDF